MRLVEYRGGLLFTILTNSSKSWVLINDGIGTKDSNTNGSFLIK